MKSYTEHLWFNTKKRREYLNITPEVQKVLRKSGVQEGLCLVNAMHITASVYINDDERGLIQDFDEFLEMVARGDILGADYLRKSGRCFVSKGGVRISVIKSSWGKVKVRAYVGDSTVVFWAQPQSVRE